MCVRVELLHIRFTNAMQIHILIRTKMHKERKNDVRVWNSRCVGNAAKHLDVTSADGQLRKINALIFSVLDF